MGREGSVTQGTLSSIKGLDVFRSPVNRANCLLKPLSIKLLKELGSAREEAVIKNGPCPRTSVMH